MSFLKSSLKGSLPGILVGVVATLAAPIALAAFAVAGRPVLKAAIKSYLTLASKAKEVVHEVGEQVSDIVAEAKSEHDLNGATPGVLKSAEEMVSSPSRTT